MLLLMLNPPSKERDGGGRSERVGWVFKPADATGRGTRWGARAREFVAEAEVEVEVAVGIRISFTTVMLVLATTPSIELKSMNSAPISSSSSITGSGSGSGIVACAISKDGCMGASSALSTSQVVALASIVPSII